jgi:hypothetical protein
VRLARDEDGQPFRPRDVRQAPVHAEPLGNTHESEVLLEHTRERKLDAHEERALTLLRRVLVRVDDVRAVLEQELRDGGDDARPIGTRDEQPGDVAGCCHPEVSLRAEGSTAAVETVDPSLRSG